MLTKVFFVIVMSKLPMAFTGLTQAPFLASLYLNQNAKVIFLRSLLKLTCNSNDKSIQRYIRLVQKVFQRAKVIANVGFPPSAETGVKDKYDTDDTRHIIIEFIFVLHY